METIRFDELELSGPILRAVADMGFEATSPIQAQAIPVQLEGRDIIGQAQTGTGKTAAFGIPLLQKINPKSKKLQAIVLCPTRELAIQVAEEIRKLAKYMHGIKVLPIYGGQDIVKQIRSLKTGVQIVIGTPGRVMDHMRRKTVKMDQIHTVVLDEADEMLNMGFLDDIEAIIKETPEKRQTLLFSATMPPEIKRIGVQFMRDPQMVKIKAKELTTDLVDQYYVRAKDYEKFDIMTRLIDVQDPDLTIVFGRTKRRVDELSRGLVARGYNAAGIHGDLTQDRRSKIMKKFKNGDLDILVATDVAARGLDISGVTHVYNYDIPSDPDSYVHRIGRTGRAGHHGVSLTFVTPNEMDYLHEIEKLTRVRMLPLKPPTEEEAFRGQVASAVNDIDDLIKDEATDKYRQSAEKLLATHDAVDLVAALLNDLTTDDASKVPVKITPERPLPKRHRHHQSRGRNGRNNHHYRGHRNSGERRHYGKRRSNGHKFSMRRKKD